MYITFKGELHFIKNEPLYFIKVHDMERCMYIAFKGELLFIKNEPLYYIKVSLSRNSGSLSHLK